jgi:hypothetical protein
MMNGQLPASVTELGHSWTRMVTTFVWGPWVMLASGLRAAETVLGAAAPRTGRSPGQLIEIARERLSKGLAPPSEIYQVPYRNQIDWTQFPDWARPSDPELFGDLPHEG